MKVKEKDCTEWYLGYIKPVRAGWYQCKCCKDLFWWNGKNWALSNDPRDVRTILSSWRGLRSPAP